MKGGHSIAQHKITGQKQKNAWTWAEFQEKD
jgi:hypothetical protein